jgi:2'-5' RNA ligase
MIRDDTFVLTLRMDEVSFARLDEWRRRYFPPDLNFIPAHLTLFDALAPEQVSRLAGAHAGLSSQAIPLQFVRPFLIGRGVAIAVARGELTALHGRMIEVLGPGLTRQDRAPFRPHVTIQNKVTREDAKATFTRVSSNFEPWSGHGIGLDVWRYHGAKWAPHLHLAFTQP